MERLLMGILKVSFVLMIAAVFAASPAMAGGPNTSKRSPEAEKSRKEKSKPFKHKAPNKSRGKGKSNKDNFKKKK